ncbi:hypothetical protein AB0H28_10200 [Micromonospora sp. NPDC050980]|uniref:hypothetical protein n=1 Tax=Micromonospora sp. NPDC050980 TaxID=3155161 RepID=UPI0033DB6A0B
MRPDEFRQALDLFPATLHARVLPLRRHVFRTGCARCRSIGDTVTLALTAAHYDQLTSAGQLLDNAIRLAADHGAACRPRPDQERGRGEIGPGTSADPPVVAGWKGRAGHPGGASRRDGHVSLTG